MAKTFQSGTVSFFPVSKLFNDPVRWRPPAAILFAGKCGGEVVHQWGHKFWIAINDVTNFKSLCLRPCNFSRCPTKKMNQPVRKFSRFFWNIFTYAELQRRISWGGGREAYSANSFTKVGEDLLWGSEVGARGRICRAVWGATGQRIPWFAALPEFSFYNRTRFLFSRCRCTGPIFCATQTGFSTFTGKAILMFRFGLMTSFSASRGQVFFEPPCLAYLCLSAF